MKGCPSMAQAPKVGQVVAQMQRAKAALVSHAGSNKKLSQVEAARARVAAGDAGGLVDLLVQGAADLAGKKPVPLSAITEFTTRQEASLREIAKNDTLSLAEEKRLDAFSREAARLSRSGAVPPASATETQKVNAKAWADGRDFSSAATQKLEVPRVDVTVKAGVPSKVVDDYVTFGKDGSFRSDSFN